MNVIGSDTVLIDEPDEMRRRRTPLARWHRSFCIAAVICAALLASTGCGDAGPPSTTPSDPSWPIPPQHPPRVAALTEWFASYPDDKYRGVFHSDDAGRLAKYEFGSFWPDGSHHITLFVLYEHSAEQLTRTETHVRLKNGDFGQVGESEFFYDSAGHLGRQVNRQVDEVSGEIVESTQLFEYDSSGRLVETIFPSRRTTFVYDAMNNVVRSELTREGVPTLAFTYTHDRSLNPLAGPPPSYHGMQAIMGHGSSPYNLSGWAAQEPEKAPASVAAITYDLDERRYPLRRTEATTNTSTPQTTTTIISEFQYAE